MLPRKEPETEVSKTYVLGPTVGGCTFFIRKNVPLKNSIFVQENAFFKIFGGNYKNFSSKKPGISKNRLIYPDLLDCIYCYTKNW